MIMKNLLALLLVSAFAMAPAAAEEKAPATKKVCVDAQGKDGKPVIDPKTKKPKQECKEVKVHKKHEGTKPEDVKKK
jgi:azurin